MLSVFVAFGSADAGDEDADELVSFFGEWFYFLCRGNQFCAENQFDPAFGLSEFFEGDAEFVDEVGMGFCSLGFSMMGERCGATAQQLVCDVTFRVVAAHAFGERYNRSSVVQ